MTKDRQKEEVLIALGAKTCWCERIATKAISYSDGFTSYQCDEHTVMRIDSDEAFTFIRIVMVQDL